MDRGHESESIRQAGLHTSRSPRRTTNTPPIENDQEEGGGEVFPATEWTRHDRPLSKGEMGMDRYGQVLVVRPGKAEQGASVQGVQRMEGRDQGVMGNGWKHIREKG